MYACVYTCVYRPSLRLVDLYCSLCACVHFLLCVVCVMWVWVNTGGIVVCRMALYPGLASPLGEAEVICTKLYV